MKCDHNKRLLTLIVITEMPLISFFHVGSAKSFEKQAGVLFFHFVEDLPFPLSMPYHLRLAFGIYLTLILIGGLVCRKMIMEYLRAPETKSKPINSLIWIDQICGLVFGTSAIIFAAAALILPVSIRSLMNEQFCNWLPLTGNIYLTGLTIWSAFIAIYRTLYIKAQNWVKHMIGEKQLLWLSFGLGLFFQFALSLTIFYFDEESFISKICNHYTSNYIDILQEYSVS